MNNKVKQNHTLKEEEEKKKAVKGLGCGGAELRRGWGLGWG